MNFYETEIDFSDDGFHQGVKVKIYYELIKTLFEEQSLASPGSANMKASLAWAS